MVIGQLHPVAIPLVVEALLADLLVDPAVLKAPVYQEIRVSAVS